MPSPTAPPPGAQTPSPVPNRPGTDYADLMRRGEQAGLLDRRPGYYLTKIAATAVLLATGWTASALLGDTWWQLAVAGFLAPTPLRFYAQALQHLHEVGRPLRVAPAGELP
jgi:hypothetical protein